MSTDKKDKTMGQARLRIVVFAVAAAALAGVLGVGATQPVPLPEFEVAQLDGTPVQSHTGLPSSGKWLIVYVQPNCRPCDRLLNLVKMDAHPELPPRMVIIAGGLEGPGATVERSKFKDLADAQWYTDRPGKAWVALKMSGAPMVFGVRDKAIEWSLSGVLPSDEHVRSILASWVAE
jgi:hypothetical protein